MTVIPYQKMDPQVKDIWLTALRSGDYSQETGQLHHNGPNRHGYCCLGVLVTQMFPTYVEDQFFDDRDQGRSVPTASVIDWSKVEQRAQDRLIVMNDDLGNTFGEIADWIEVNL